MGRIHFAHLRNVKVNDAGDFEETAHKSDCGSLDMAAIVKAYHDVGYEGYARPDHGRMIWGETGKPGYGLYDRALGAVYLQRAVGGDGEIGVKPQKAVIRQITKKDWGNDAEDTLADHLDVLHRQCDQLYRPRQSRHRRALHPPGTGAGRCRHGPGAQRLLLDLCRDAAARRLDHRPHRGAAEPGAGGGLVVAFHHRHRLRARHLAIRRRRG